MPELVHELTVYVDRRIGGLEIEEKIVAKVKEVDRRIGGLEKYWLYHFFCGMSHPTYINGGSCR